MIKKAVVIIALVILLSISITGCTTNTSPQAQATAAPTAVPTAEPTQSAAVLVSAKQVTVPQAIGTWTPKTGYKFVGFCCTVTNVAAGQKFLVSMPQWQLRDTKGGVYAPTTASYSSDIGGMELTWTQPGDVVSGTIVYEVPQNAQLKSITYTGTSNWVTFNLSYTT
jgi:hypothetical protein